MGQASGEHGGGRVSTADARDRELVEALRRGDEAAFASLVRSHHPVMMRVAMMYVRTRAVAEEVLQDTWVGVIRGIDRFEGRSSLRTWIFHILVNTARTRATREARTIPFSAYVNAGAQTSEPAVDPSRFLPPDHPEWPGHWASPPTDWRELPEERLLGKETLSVVRRAVDDLPPSQREVITLRDLAGWDSKDVCALLGISEGNQRVLLHRARSKVRRALERHLATESPPGRAASSLS
jgi:RNA polymerase sigma-70 factor (ECF subfamily)